MTPQKLKNSILQLAIQGKLVEQRPEEGTAEELYQQIQAEKRRLVKEGKIKQEKPLPEITEDEKQFDIPNGWIWMRLGNICNIINGFTPRKTNPEFWEKGTIPWFTIDDIHNQGRFIKNTKQHITDKAISKNSERIVPPDTVLLCCTASVGEYAYTKIPLTTNQQFNALVIKKQYTFLLYPMYLYEFVQTLKGILILNAGKTTFNYLSVGKLSNFCLPLPPLAEQKRIVAKIEELLPYIDRYKQAWGRLENLNKRFPLDMQKSLLQMAIQGKLVEQRPEEGTAEELYQQIQAEKRRLVKEGKIKKGPPLPEIAKDEVPFEIPGSWKWVRLSELINTISTGPFGSMLHKTDYVPMGTPLVNPSNIVNGKIIASDKMMVSTETVKHLNAYTLNTGMIVMGRRGELGRCAVVTDNENGWLCGTGSFFMTPNSNIFVDYIYYIFSTPYAKAYLGGESVGTTMSNLNHKILIKMPVPLPPLTEQKRIVAKLEELLPLCERLKKNGT